MKDLKHLIYFENLLQEAQNELVNKAVNEGKIALGYNCSYIPEVLLNLDGCFSSRLRAPGCVSDDVASYYMTTRNCPYVRAILERAIEGGYNYLNAVFGAEGCAAMERMEEHFDLLKPVQNPRKGKNGKFITTIIDPPMKGDKTNLDYYKVQLQNKVLNPIKETFGIDISDKAIRKAIEKHNEVCRVITEIGNMRKADNPVITGYEFHVIELVSQVCPYDEILPYLKETLEELKKRKPEKEFPFRARVVLCGSEIDDPEFTKLIEMCGAMVVADRYCFGSLPGREEIEIKDGETAFDAVCRHYLYWNQCARFMDGEKIDQRHEQVMKLYKDFKADGIIVENMKFCEFWGYEKVLASHIYINENNIPTCTIEKEYALGAVGQLRTRFQAFVESLEIKNIQEATKMAFDKIIAPIDKALQRFDPIWRAENGKGGQRDRYIDKTGVAKYREWRGVKDTMVDYFAWLQNLAYMAAMVASAPMACLKGFWEYRWMGSYLGTFMFIDRLFEGYRGEELKIAHMHMHGIVRSLTKKIAFILSNDVRLGGNGVDNIVAHDETITPLFLTGFKELTAVPLQTLPEFIICDIDQHIEPYYIDVAESFGLPADVCSRCAAETGVALDDAFPLVGKVMLSTNMPCNASEATSMFQRRRIGKPDFPITLAMQHNEPEALPYSKQVLKDAIAFVEEQYGIKYDWNELFKHAEWMNEQNTIELEKWDLFKTPYSPLTGISETLYRLYEWQSVNGTDPHFNTIDRKVIEIMRKCYKNKYQPYGGKTRHRAFLWGPSAVYYCDFPTWCQNCWGINIVLNMDSTMGYNMINTEDPEIAMDDLTRFTEKACMRHMAVGGWENINDIWNWAKNFNCDMVLFNDNVACKGMNGVHALMEEQAREFGFHFIFVEHDLQDSRTISRQDMRKCVNNYMSVVLGEEPLDPTIVEFDDSEAY